MLRLKKSFSSTGYIITQLFSSNNVNHRHGCWILHHHIGQHAREKCFVLFYLFSLGRPRQIFHFQVYQGIQQDNVNVVQLSQEAGWCSRTMSLNIKVNDPKPQPSRDAVELQEALVWGHCCQREFEQLLMNSYLLCFSSGFSVKSGFCFIWANPFSLFFLPSFLPPTLSLILLKLILGHEDQYLSNFPHCQTVFDHFMF